ncbi:actin filament-associated protein 1-like 2 isoform X2 [Coregonus clupeaformis]|uniref:actin filament-associated protein 1-like 2 isoform X2 n=1 Tax=Coregonus clupeaformis TaxID=59861 RepID=UPI001E1C6B7F|nr:actin filament-associated protein 1-like 2 isoform X2 [Coregonus clupeaformis]
MEKHKVLDQLLEELQCFLLILDRENLSGNATVQKGLLSDLLQSYRCSKDNRSDALANGRAGKHVPAPQKSLPDLPPPRTVDVGREPFLQPSAPAPACLELQEGYYEEAHPYDSAMNDVGCFGLLSGAWTRVKSSDNVVYAVITRDDGEAVSSSYESYDEEEVTKGKSSLSAQHQWPSTEASIELMKDARICAFLWRKKWLGQWAKQLCVIREHRFLCYKSSKEQMPLLDVSLLGCSVVYKEKQPKRKEHKLKIILMGGEAIVLGLQSKDQTEQWLKVIQEISPKPAEGSEMQHFVSDSPRLICTKGELSERYSVASESGSSTDSHAETLETKDVKKKYSAGLKFSNLMNIGKKKTSSLDSPEKCVDTSGYLNVLVNSQWRSRWCLIKNGQLGFYQDKGKTKVAQQPVPLEGCMVLPNPSPEHLYSFRIEMDGVQLATLEAKSSADMGHWLGLLLSQTGTKTDPEELTYDYVNSERISSIVNAAKTSLYLMQRRYSEPSTYIDSLSSAPHGSDDIYDDVASIEGEQEDAEESGLLDDQESSGQCRQDSTGPCGQDGDVVVVDSAGQVATDKVYLDLIPVRSFLHTSCGRGSPNKEPPRPSPTPPEEQQDLPSQVDSSNQSEKELPPSHNGVDPTAPTNRPEQECPLSPSPLRPHTQTQKTSLLSQDMPRRASPGIQHPQDPSTTTLNIQPPKTPQSPAATTLVFSLPPHSPQPLRLRSASSGDQRTKVLSTACPGAIEVKLGKNRTEADMRLYTEERDRLEREKEEIRSGLANLKKERRETKEELSTCQDPVQQASLDACLKQKEEACREAEQWRVEVELRLMEVKESLRKAEAGPFILGTTLDSCLLDTPMAKAASMGPPQTPSPPTNYGDSSPVNSATSLKNRPPSIMASSKGNVLQKAKEWEKKSTT